MIQVSVIIPYYNSKNTIIRALESALNQTYKLFEIILIDDGSIDGSYELVERYLKENNITNAINLSQSNKGPSAARNFGVQVSNGEYIAFLDSDDSWDINKLEIQIKFLKQNSDIAILGCDYKVFCDENVTVKSKNLKIFQRVGFYKRLFKNYFCTPTVVIKKDAFVDVGGFNEKQKYAEDQLLFMRLLRKYEGGKIQLPLACIYKYEYGVDGLSLNLRELEKYELRNFNILRNENKFSHKKINLFLYVIVISFSYLKYLRRLLIIRLRK